jgi:chemotaxis protein CheX
MGCSDPPGPPAADAVQCAVMTTPAPMQPPLHIQAILAATRQTLGRLFGEEPIIEAPVVKPAHSPSESEVNVMVGFTGDVKGQILLGLSRQMAQDMAGTLLGSPLDDFDGLVKSAMAELGNITAGSCATALHEHGLESSITLPTVIVGDHVQVSWPHLYILETPVRSRFGPLTLAIGLTIGHSG